MAQQGVVRRVLPLLALLVIGDPMNIERLILLLGNRLVGLRNQLVAAEEAGDVDVVLAIESEITDTELTITQLQSLL